MAYMSVDERRDAFVDAAVELIAAEGLAKATTRRIAERAGAPLGALHYCFRNKNELMELMAERGAATIHSALADVDPSLGLESTIRTSVDAYWRWVRDNLGLQLALLELGLWMVRNRREEVYAQWNVFGVEQLRRHLQAACQADDVDPARPIEDIVQFLFHRIDALVLELAASGNDEGCQRQVDLLADALVAVALPVRLEARTAPAGSRRGRGS
jgi:AcrR family transcriptional regulator